MQLLIYAAIALGAYLIGSISPALIISRLVEKTDVRKYGSGNAGATNMVRNFGWLPGLATFALDMLKGAGQMGWRGDRRGDRSRSGSAGAQLPHLLWIPRRKRSFHFHGSNAGDCAFA